MPLAPHHFTRVETRGEGQPMCGVEQGAARKLRPTALWYDSPSCRRRAGGWVKGGRCGAPPAARAARGGGGTALGHRRKRFGGSTRRVPPEPKGSKQQERWGRCRQST